MHESEALKDQIVTESEKASASELAAKEARDDADDAYMDAMLSGGDTTVLATALSSAQSQAEIAN